jgi:hypothetical protein
VLAGLGWLLGYDHQSTARLFSLPSVLDIREWDSFCVYLKIPFGGVRHHLLKGFDQNVASWNPPQYPELLVRYCAARLLEA